jgi:hypothetical protein
VPVLISIFSSETLARLLVADSFDSPWYWLFFAVLWTLTTYWTLGVGHHESQQISKDSEARADFERAIDIYARRSTRGFDQYGVFFTAFMCFLMAGMATIGLVFNATFIQALFWLLFPLMIAIAISVRTCYKLTQNPVTGDALYRTYLRLRRTKQVIGMIAIMITSFWGALVLFQKWALLGA